MIAPAKIPNSCDGADNGAHRGVERAHVNSRLGCRLGRFPKHRGSVRLVVLLVAVAVCAAPGCVRRRLTVRTTPPGALVYIDGQFIGTTPVSTDFTYYGTRKIELIKDGFETQTVKQEFSPPWYQYPGLDFINENLNPREIRDERELHFTLAAQRIVPAEELLGRGDYLRASARQGVVTPLPNSGAWGASEVNVAPPPGYPNSFAPPAAPRVAPPAGAPSENWIGPSEQVLPPESISEGFVRPPSGSSELPAGDPGSSSYNFAPPTRPNIAAPPSYESGEPGASPPSRSLWPDFGPGG
jgi:hypothetical protein